LTYGWCGAGNAHAWQACGCVEYSWELTLSPLGYVIATHYHHRSIYHGDKTDPDSTFTSVFTHPYASTGDCLIIYHRLVDAHILFAILSR